MTDPRTETPAPPHPDSLDPRIRMAAERTYLAWVRTGVALMGFGFVVARFGLFLREISAMRSPAAEEAAQAAQSVAARPSLSMWVGVGLVALGVLTELWAVGRHVQVQRSLDAGRAYPSAGWGVAAVAGVLTALLGVVMTGYLVTLGR
jgi:putative membrane protein